MVDEITGSHPVLSPATERTTGFVVDVKHIVAVAAFLGLGGVGGGMLSFSGNHVDTDKLATKESVEAVSRKLDALIDQTSAASLSAARVDAATDAFKATTAKQLGDLEDRVRVIERRR